jgi:hypothetical protein
MIEAVNPYGGSELIAIASVNNQYPYCAPEELTPDRLGCFLAYPYYPILSASYRFLSDAANCCSAYVD